MYKWVIPMGVTTMVASLIGIVTTMECLSITLTILVIIFIIGYIMTLIGIFDLWKSSSKFNGIPRNHKEIKNCLKLPKPNWEDFTNYSYRDFVESMYNRILCRKSDEGVLNDYTKRLKEDLDRRKLIDALWDSPERKMLEEEFSIKGERNKVENLHSIL